MRKHKKTNLQLFAKSRLDAIRSLLRSIFYFFRDFLPIRRYMKSYLP